MMTMEPEQKIKEMEPEVSPLADRALGLMIACDRIDAMPVGEARDRALKELLARVLYFEDEASPTEKEVALLEAEALV